MHPISCSFNSYSFIKVVKFFTHSIQVSGKEMCAKKTTKLRYHARTNSFVNAHTNSPQALNDSFIHSFIH